MIGRFFLRPPVGAMLNAQLNANEARSTNRKLTVDVDALLDRFDRLSLVTQAMWEVIEAHTNITENDLHAKIEEIDLRDGKRDGKITTHVMNCPQCNRKSTRRHDVCMYCEAPLNRGPFV